MEELPHTTPNPLEGRQERIFGTFYAKAGEKKLFSVGHSYFYFLVNRRLVLSYCPIFVTIRLLESFVAFEKVDDWAVNLEGIP